MIIKSLDLENYRNYKNLYLEFDEGTNILTGENAQGKTNILEAIYLCSTTKSHRGSKDGEIINFENDEGHVRSVINKKNEEIRIDLHLRKSKSKVIALNLEKLKKTSELIGILNVVLFSPEDLNIIKGGPSYRRSFIDMQICRLDSSYVFNLSSYNKIIDQRNKLLKDIYFEPALKETLFIWDSQLQSYGSQVIKKRKEFVEELNEIVKEIHYKLTGQKEFLDIKYEPDTLEDEIEKNLRLNAERDLKSKMTSCGPHRDDYVININGIDARKFGSQGQQRTAALSLKLAEIEIIKKNTNDSPIFLLDDVLSELDSNRQNMLLESISDIQTIITCTGLDDFVNERFTINRVFDVHDGIVEVEK
ncbi:MAG: DNA replication/repair protein RecF [Lachnospiraceae bacterium]|nr:DNA replication/repair protein RecF [Lachnospiraceae bacterium]